MIPWMLGRLELSPYAVFSQRELIERFPEEFEQARRERLILRVAGPPTEDSTGSYAHPSGKTYVVVPVAGGYEAFDDEDPEVDPINVETIDLVQWTLDLEVFAERVQQANDLSGQPEALDSRLWFLGATENDDLRVAYLLGLFDGGPSTTTLLESLPVRLGLRYHRIIVVCPSYEPALMQQRSLDALRINVSRLSDEDVFVVSGVSSPTLETDELDIHVRTRLIAGSQEQAREIEAFRHSDDYRDALLRGRAYALAPLQAEVVSSLHQAFRMGSRGLSWRAISARLSGNASRMSGIFKNSDPRSDLVVYEKRGRVYRLNI